MVSFDIPVHGELNWDPKMAVILSQILAEFNGRLSQDGLADTVGQLSHPTAMLPWYAALANRDSARASIAALGTSMTEGGPNDTGTGLSARGQRWVDRLALGLRSALPLASPVAGSTGYIPAFYASFLGGGVSLPGSNWTDNQARIRPTEVTYTITTPITPAGAGLGSRTIELKQSGDAIKFAFVGTGCDCYINSRAVANSTATYKVDGGAAQTAPVPAGTTAGAVIQVRGLAAGPHTIEVIWGSGQVDVDGVYPYNGDEAKGIHVWEGGRGSAKANDVLSPAAFRPFSSIQPALLLIEFGYNEFFAPIDLPSFQSSLQTLVTNALAPITKAPTVVFIQWAEPYDATPAPDSYAAYMNVVKTVANNTPNSVILDFRGRYPANTPNSLGMWNGDRVHDSPVGAAYKADVMTQFLLPR